MNSLSLLSGTSNLGLSQAIAKDLGKNLVNAQIGTFSDGEIQVEILESVREMDVFVIQSTCFPGAHNMMELLIMLDALKRASAKRITAVIPYFGFARQDRKAAPRAPITAKLAADIITAAGPDRVLTIDLHAGQIQGFFNMPVDHLYSSNVILDYLLKQYNQNNVVVSPDAGGVLRVRYYGKKLDASIALMNKKREAKNKSEVMEVVGEVSGMTALLVDDMIDTGGTIVNAANAILNKGAIEVVAACTHPVLSGEAVKKLADSRIKEIIVTDTIPLTDEAKACPKITVLSVSKMLAEAVRRIHNGNSVSSMFDYEAK
ncbi:MAG: ribose-phosphate pyrophosphokinase [bacterium]|nr:ribose-phosphate pyrophosphokinase [bacterium]